MPCLKYYSIERYIEWNPLDLVIMTKSEHIRWHHKGASRPQSTRDKMSKNRRNKSCGGNNHRAHKRYCVELDVVFDSAVDAERVVGITASNIKKCCNDYSKTAGGYHWLNYEDYLRLKEGDAHV